MEEFNKINADDILKHLKTSNISLLLYESVTSTNTVLKKMAASGENEGTVIVALSQTAGRGRYDRKFYSDFGGLYISILLRPQISGFDITLLTSATAIAVSNAIDEISDNKTQIKWVNDILIDRKKVCGILCEGGFCGENAFVVVGIGINACPPENGLNCDISDIAATVFDSYSRDNMAKLCAKVIDNLFYQYEHLESRAFLNTYRLKNAVLGKKVNILKQGEAIAKATALEIDNDCRLIVKQENGEITPLISGEVSIKF